jgi:NTP pyrophosphatase (non-canonical NTP hydrolase)
MSELGRTSTYKQGQLNMAIDWKLFQKEHRDWQVPNFGEPDPFEMHVGLVEELGELSHSILKMRQGIRGTKEEHYLAMEDAVGDMVIYYTGCWLKKLLHLLVLWHRVASSDFFTSSVLSMQSRWRNPLSRLGNRLVSAIGSPIL